MLGEIPYRIALFIVIVLLSSITYIFRRRAVTPNEKIGHDEEGWVPYIALQSAAVVLWLSTFAYLLVPSAIAWASMPIPSVFRWLSFGAAIVASLLMIWTLASLGKNLTDTVVTKSYAILVTTGPYNWVRHPYYSTTAIAMFSVTILTANWIVGLGCVLVLTLLAIRTPKEEAKLEERFGNEYLNYKAKTGMFVPRIMQNK
jgi:protein-S-isoprenylcysteine O-methyltransferase Ste14